MRRGSWERWIADDVFRRYLLVTVSRVLEDIGDPVTGCVAGKIVL